MFGLISKKRLIKESVDIYLLEDTSDGCDSKCDFYYRAGNANALNALCSRLGIDLTAYIKERKREVKEPKEE